MQVRKPVVTKAASFTLDIVSGQVGQPDHDPRRHRRGDRTLPTPPTGSMSWDGYSVEFTAAPTRT
jgi:hypothetical protein